MKLPRKFTVGQVLDALDERFTTGKLEHASLWDELEDAQKDLGDYRKSVEEGKVKIHMLWFMKYTVKREDLDFDIDLSLIHI